MSELEELKLAYAECSRQRNELLNKLKSHAQQESVGYVAENGVVDWNGCAPPVLTDLYTSPPKRKPLTLWTEAQHERAYRNSPELHKDVKSLAAFKRVAKEIAAMYGIKENT